MDEQQSGRWDELQKLVRNNPNVFSSDFLDDLYGGLRDLANGSVEQVVIARLGHSGVAQVRLNQMTTGAGAGGVAGQTPEG